MKPTASKYLFPFILLFMSWSAQAQSRKDSTQIIAYIKQYKDIAIREMERSNIPASITLAQGIHESSFGTSYLAKNTNNHFGIKCKSNWTGKTFKYTDDAPNECFRVYETVEDSYKDHTDFLLYRPYYAGLFKLDKHDYKAWAHGLKKAGYATNPKYAEIIIKTIEDYQLAAFDRGELPAYIIPEVPAENIVEEIEQTLIDSTQQSQVPQAEDEKKKIILIEKTVTSVPTLTDKPIKINGKKAIYSTADESLAAISHRFAVTKEKLLQYNDLKSEQPIAAGTPIFLQAKRKKNKEANYTVQTGDNMWRIAQQKGIRLQQLQQFNLLAPGEEPLAGEMLSLNGKVTDKPKVQTGNIPAAAPIAIVRANDTVYPPIKENYKSTIDSNKLLDWEKDTKLLEKSPVTPAQTTISQPKPVDIAPVSTPQKTATTENAVTPTVYPAQIDYANLPKSSNGYHTVVKGDTLYNIAKRYQISLAQLQEWNEMSEQTVKLGQVLKIQP